MEKRQIITIIAILAGLIVAAIVLSFTRDSETEQPIDEDTRKTVTVQSLSDFTQTAFVERKAVVEPEVSSPIVARSGGRLTSLEVEIGESVTQGQLLGRTDGGAEPNIPQAQLATASRSLQLFDLIEQQALISADNAVRLAEQSLATAKIGNTVTPQTQRTQLDIASNAVQQTLESLRTAKELQDNNAPAAGPTVDAAELAVESARLAQNQAAFQADVVLQQSADVAAQARIGLENAQSARARTKAELATQRTQLAGQVAVANEQLKLHKIISGVDGQVTQLTGSVGDFLSPGATIGEVAQIGSAKLNLDVSVSIANTLTEGQRIQVQIGQKTQSGVIDALSPAATQSGLFNVTIVIPNGVSGDDYGKVATVQLPAGNTSGNSVFLPLDTISTRADGTYVFVVNELDIAERRSVAILSYQGNLVEVQGNVFPPARIVVEGNRLLQDGDSVIVEPVSVQ